jgi:myo-inositol-1(or 4)-monophosphatase
VAAHHRDADVDACCEAGACAGGGVTIVPPTRAVMTSDPILAVAVRAARRAGSIAVDAARDLKRLAAHAREHGDIAAAARADARSAIVATLRAAFPAHAIVCDGAAPPPASAGAGDDCRWLVDPIDGNANFAHGYPHFAVSIALLHGHEITHAVILDPIHDELFMATRGNGAELNGAAIRVSSCTGLDRALVGTVFPSPTNPRMSAYLGVFGTLVPRCAGIRRAGAGALDLAYVAAGRLDGFWVMSLQPWDVAAGALIVREAGGRVGDFVGGGAFLRTNELIAAAPGIFNPLRESIAGALAAP